MNFKTVEGEGSSGGSNKGSKLRKGVNKIAGELKSMMENGEEYITDKTKFSGSFGDEEEGEEISVSKSGTAVLRTRKMRETGWKL